MKMRMAFIALVLSLVAASVVPPLTAAAPLQAHATAGTTETREQGMRRIVRAWNRLLNAEDNAGIARLFRPPALFTQGGTTYRLTSAADIATWHEGLPCSGRITTIVISGRFATAAFVLGDRKHSRCDAPGKLAAARFEIVRGKIVSWTQVAAPNPGREA